MPQGIRTRGTKLPNGDRADIDVKNKLEGYCLNPDHEEGTHKARVFQSQLGLNRHNVGLLVEALKQAARSGDAIESRRDEYGRRYRIDFEFKGPNGNMATIHSIWIVEIGKNDPRFITCYVEKSSVVPKKEDD